MNRILLALAVLLLSVGCSEGPESPTPSNSSAVEVIKITAEDLDERAEEYRNNLDEFLENWKGCQSKQIPADSVNCRAFHQIREGHPFMKKIRAEEWEAQKQAIKESSAKIPDGF
ncbi:MAG: hypothetical protein GKS05_13195 [Nitrospirales bacterium]|nr:hypothetical protein [Nitrospirales bacterium]